MVQTFEVFRSMHQSIITKIKNYADEDWIFKSKYKQKKNGDHKQFLYRLNFCFQENISNNY